MTAIQDEKDKVAADSRTAQDRQMAVAEAMESIISNLAANTQGDETYSSLTPDSSLGFHENLAASYTPVTGDWRTGSSNLPYDVAQEYDLGTSQRAHGPVINQDTGYRHGYTVGGKQIPDDIAALMAAERYGSSGALYNDDAFYEEGLEKFWDDEEDYLGDVMREYDEDYFGGDDRDDSPMIIKCERAGGTWVNGACVMPKADTSAADKDAELEDFINSFDPFTSIKRAKWIHPLQGYETSNLWDYKPPQIEDWTPGLRDWAGV